VAAVRTLVLRSGARASFVALLLLFFDLSRITGKTEAVDESSTTSRIADHSSQNAAR
jgi:hypothetical protein